MILEAGKMRLELLRTQGEVLEMIATYGPGAPPPPRHFHPRQEERFQVRSGTIWFEVDGRERVLRKGDSLTVPPGVVHRAKNASEDEPAIMHWETRPALRSAQLFEALYAMAREGRSLLTTASIMREFRQEFVLASPAPRVQSCVFALLAPLARALGRDAAFTR